MLRILIVDDEQQERDGLEKLILKNNFELDIIKAKNGEDALDLLSHHQVDILLTDIKMPFLDGIALIDRIKNTHHDTFFILYSAYADFEYAQSAISLRIHKYLLKPVSIKDFTEILQEAIEWCILNKTKKKEEEKKLELIEESKYYLLEKNIQQLLNRRNNEEYPTAKIKKMEPRFATNNFIPILVCCNADVFLNSIKSLSNIESIYFLIDEDVFLIFLFTKKGNSIKHIAEEFSNTFLSVAANNINDNVFIIIGNNLEHIDNLKKEFEGMYTYIDDRYFISQNTVIYINKLAQIQNHSFPLSIYLEKIATLVEIRNFAEANEEIDKLGILIQDNLSYNPMYIKYIFTEMIKKICQRTNIEVNISDLVNQIYSTKSIGQTIKVVKSVLHEIRQKIQMKIGNNRLIQDVKNIIFKNYNSLDLSLTFIAEKVQVTPAYLSSLFKTETEENLTSFITEYRIKQAKYLLKTTNRKVADVGISVGYQNQSYFISIFRNKVGMTPAQYREREYKNV